MIYMRFCDTISGGRPFDFVHAIRMSQRLTDEDLRRLFETAVSDMRRHFDIAGERLEKGIDLVAEGVVRLDQKLDVPGR